MAARRAFSFKRREYGYFSTLRGNPHIGGMITWSGNKRRGPWYWSLGDEDFGGLFVDGWAATLKAARQAAEDAGNLMLQGIHPRYDRPFSLSKRCND